jgi:hypothetical protein
VREYVAHHLEDKARSDRLVAAAARGLDRLALLRAFVAWRSKVPKACAREATPAWRRTRVLGRDAPRLWENESRWWGSAPVAQDHTTIQARVTIDSMRFGGSPPPAGNNPYASCPLEFVVNKVLPRLGYTRPCVCVGTTELLFGTQEEHDAEMGDGAYARNLEKSLDECGLRSKPLEVSDDDDDALAHRITVHFAFGVDESQREKHSRRLYGTALAALAEEARDFVPLSSVPELCAPAAAPPPATATDDEIPWDDAELQLGPSHDGDDRPRTSPGERESSEARLSTLNVSHGPTHGTPTTGFAIELKPTDLLSYQRARVRCEKRHFLRHLYIKMIILPRLARDKHGKS